MSFNIINNSPSPEYHLFYSNDDPTTPSIVIPITLDPGSSVSSGQPHHEFFSTHSEMVTRAEELGYVFPSEPDSDSI